jgi:AraC family transcriptional activator of mtrCDE
VDVIERLLANMEVGVGAFACCDIRRGHQLTFDARPAAGVHYCLAGQGALRLRSGESVKLRQHSFVLLPPDIIYSLGANKKEDLDQVPRRRLRPSLFKESVPTLTAGVGASGLVTVCGEIRFAGIGAPGLFSHLSKPLVEHFDARSGLREQFVILLAESARPQFGTRPLTEALLKQCLILLLRRTIARGAPSLPWLAALADPRLARAMQAILQHFAQPLTLEALASMAGMSRSSFASRFLRSFGRTPMSLLRAARLDRAKELLATSNFSVSQIASKVGFPSRSNFSRSFSQEFGVDPSTFRANSLVAAELPSKRRRGKIAR